MGPRFKRPVGPTREGRKVAVKGWVDFLLRMGPRGLYYAAIDLYVPWSRVAILRMVIPPLIGILIMGI